MGSWMTRPDWELGVQQALLAGGRNLPENDSENRLRDLLDECWENRQSCSAAAGRILELLKLGPRNAWESEIDRKMEELVALGVEESWPELLDEAWAKHQRPAEIAREVCRLLHDEFEVGYLADALDPWHPGGGRRK
jgi:hypothetical protein